MVNALILAAALAAGVAAAELETVTLQQGLNGYAGSTARTLIDGRTSIEPDDGIFRLRGSQRSLQLRFELPQREGRLARARLMVFLPSIRNANRFTEIFCHEAITGGSQLSVDEETDYDNGRRRGAIDSVELFAASHERWPDFPFLPLGVPPGGKWIEFNITPLVQKWKSGEADNHGIVLMPTDPPDQRSASTWEIDIPTPTYSAGAQLRPKLVLEYARQDAPVTDHLLAGMVNPLERISDRSSRYAYRGGYRSSYHLSMAANEFEGFQIVLYPMLADLEGVQLQFSDLVSSGGQRIPAADLRYFLEDSFQLRRNYLTRELFGGKLYEVVDPLVPAKTARLRRLVHTPLYVLLRSRPDTAAGVYRGRIAVLAGAAVVKELDLEVKVWPYAIPEKWSFHAIGEFIWDTVQRFHGEQANDQLFLRYYDFLIEHRFSPTEQYRNILSPRMNLEDCLKRGLNTIYLSGNFEGAPGEIEQLRHDYDRVKALKVLDHTLVYIGDETDKWDEMRRRADLLHAHFPGVQVMIGGSYPRPELLGYVDIYDPQLSGTSKVYSLQQDQVGLVQEAQQRGEEFYWYVAAGPQYPYPNVQLEYPLTDSRMLFWMTWKYGITGFEYYCYNLWERNYTHDPARRYPNSQWKPDGWSKGWPTNSDGILFYPGPISSLRFEAMRDGIEDWESLLLLSDAVDEMRRRADADRYAGLISRADAMLAVDDKVVAGLRTFSRDPDRLLAEREKLGELISEIVPILGGPAALQVAAAERIERQSRLRRDMLRQRHLDACKRIQTSPLSAAEWDRLWP